MPTAVVPPGAEEKATLGSSVYPLPIFVTTTDPTEPVMHKFEVAVACVLTPTAISLRVLI